MCAKCGLHCRLVNVLCCPCPNPCLDIKPYRIGAESASNVTRLDDAILAPNHNVQKEAKLLNEIYLYREPQKQIFLCGKPPQPRSVQPARNEEATQPTLSLPAPNEVEQPDTVAVDVQGRHPPPSVEEVSDDHGAPSNARKQRLAKCTIATHDDSSTMGHKLNENITPAQHPSSSRSIEEAMSDNGHDVEDVPRSYLGIANALQMASADDIRVISSEMIAMDDVTGTWKVVTEETSF